MRQIPIVVETWGGERGFTSQMLSSLSSFHRHIPSNTAPAPCTGGKHDLHFRIRAGLRDHHSEFFSVLGEVELQDFWWGSGPLLCSLHLRPGIGSAMRTCFPQNPDL